MFFVIQYFLILCFLCLYNTTASDVHLSTSFCSDGDAECQDKKSISTQSHPFSMLPGDPSMNILTNVDLKDGKLEVMKAVSKVIAAHTGKPESYVAVTITDKASIIFGGTDELAALGTMYSIGKIESNSNGKITSDVTDLLEPFGVAENRIYINFFDMDRANVGWSRRTFAGGGYSLAEKGEL